MKFKFASVTYRNTLNNNGKTKWKNDEKSFVCLIPLCNIVLFSFDNLFIFSR